MSKLYRATHIKPYFGTLADIGRALGVHYNRLHAMLNRGENEIYGFVIEEVQTITYKGEINLDKLTLQQLHELKDDVYRKILNYEKVKQ